MDYLNLTYGSADISSLCQHSLYTAKIGSSLLEPADDIYIIHKII